MQPGAFAQWRKSSTSGGVNCVEVRVDADAVQVRHSKDCRGAVLTFTHQEWKAFLAGVKSGEFELPSHA